MITTGLVDRLVGWVSGVCVCVCIGCCSSCRRCLLLDVSVDVCVCFRDGSWWFAPRVPIYQRHALLPTG